MVLEYGTMTGGNARRLHPDAIIIRHLTDKTLFFFSAEDAIGHPTAQVCPEYLIRAKQ